VRLDREENVAVECFYSDFTAQKEQSSMNMLSALLKQVVGALGERQGGIAQAYEDQKKKAIDGWGRQLSNIMKMPQATASNKRAFVCINALNEFSAESRVKLLNLIKKANPSKVFRCSNSHDWRSA